MASFSAYLDVNGQHYPLLTYELSIHQQTDTLGRPASPTLGGQIDCTLSAPGAEQPFLMQWMFSPTMQQDGRIVLLQETPKATLKTISFFNAYCTGLQTHFVPGAEGGGSLQMQLRISPQRIAVGAIVHDNNWPLESHGAGERFAQQAVASPTGQAKKEEEPSAFMEGLHGVLDVVGMIPVLGEVADAANAAIYLGEGRYGEAALSAASMIPLAGNVVGAAKIGRRALKLADKLSGVTALASKAAKRADKALDAVKGPLKKLRKTCGDPVDVASGEVLAEAIDFSLPGPIPLVWERTWYSSATYQGALGHGWHHGYDWAIIAIADDGTVGIRDGEGRLVAFEAPQPDGKGIQSERLALFLDVNGSYRVWQMDELRWYVFGPATAAQTHAQPLQRIEEPNGFGISFTYQNNTRLSAITDSAGRVLQVDTDGAGHITAVYSPQAAGIDSFALVRYVYDDDADLVTVIDAEEHPMHYQYRNHQLVRRTARMGTNWYFEYESDEIGARCVHTWGDGGLLEYTLQYDSESQTTVLDSYQQPTVYSHQAGLVTRQVDALGGEQLWTYSETGQLLAYRDALSNVSRYEYDEQGRSTAFHLPEENSQSVQYNEYGLPAVAKNAVGGRWNWQYDQRGNLLQQTDPLGNTTNYLYTDKGLLSTLVDPAGNSIQLRYDEQANIAHIITPDQAIRSQTFDELGRLLTSIDVDGSEQKRSYDRLGQLRSLTDTDGNLRELVYDLSGNVIEARQAGQLVHFSYNALGQTTSRRETNTEVRFVYDLEGRLIEMYNEAGARYTFDVNATGHVVAEQGFDGQIRQYDRDMAGQVLKLTRASGKTTQYTYTLAGQIARALHHDGEQEIYDYDAAGAVIKASTNDTVVYLRRDVMSRIMGEMQGKHQVDSVYDALGNRTALTSSLGASLALDHDQMGNVSAMQAEQWQAKFGYDSRGLEVQRQLSGGIQLTRQRNVLGRVTTQQTATTTQTSLRSYQWQTPFQLRAVDDNRLGTVQYAHDLLSNLTEASYNDGVELRSPDTVGNLFETANRQDRRYAPNGQLLATANARYDYDADGNLIRKTTSKGEEWQYEWDGAGQLRQVIRPDKVAVQFIYDALGRRVRKTYKGKTTHWVWDGDKPLHEWETLELDGTNTDDIITWLFEEDSFAPIAKLQGAHRQSILTDYLGTPLEMIDQHGQRTWLAETTSYGRLRLSQGNRAECPFRFPGQYEDVETGLYYNRARYYDPEAGTYISQDPLRLLSGEPNLYAYVQDPTRFIDVLGLHGAELGNVADSILYHIKINGETFKYGIGTEKFATKSDISVLAPDGVTQKIIPKGTSTRLYQQLRKAYSNYDDVVVEVTKHPGISTADMRDIEDRKIQSYFDRRGKVPSGNTGHAVGGRQAEDLFGGVSDLKKHLSFKCNL